MAKFTLKKSLIKVTEEEGNSFEVRGLSFNDVTQLLSLHRPAMEGLFKQYIEQNPESFSIEDVSERATEVAAGMLGHAPALAAHVIALGADDVDSFDDYAMLPMGIQLDAISDIGALTLESAGGAKKFMALLASLITAKGEPNR